jgi:hypothetical protein
MVDISKSHFANFFGIFTDPQASLQTQELGFTSDYRLVYKDASNTLRYLPSIYDYQNIYNPATIQITQTAKDATLGVGTEGDFSAKVTTSIPHSLVVTATGIHERQVLIQYSSTNVVKDIMTLPEYFCKIDTAADVFDVNKGVMTEAVAKYKISAHLGRTQLTNNATFILVKVENTTTQTTLGYPMTTEANKDNIANRNQLYIDADGFLVLIKDKAVTDLDYPIWVFNRRSVPIEVKLPNKYFLFAKNDKFSVKTYRRYSDTAMDTTYQLVRDNETVQLTQIVQSDQVTSIRVSSEKLAISANKKSITGLVRESHYEIVVLTDEVRTNPTFQYQILDITDGFFSYMYRVLKNVSDNGSRGVGGYASAGIASKKYLFEYTYIAEEAGISSFTIPEQLYAPVNGDREFLYYHGVRMERGIDYTVVNIERRITLNFQLNQGDQIQAIIFKYADNGGEIYMISALQNYVNTVNADLTAFKAQLVSNMGDVPKYNMLPDAGRFMGSAVGRFDLTSTGAFDSGLLFKTFNNSVLTDAGKYTYNTTSFGGAGAAIPQTIIDLMNTMPTRAGLITRRRYAPEFRVLQIVAGNGTTGGYASKYPMTTNGSIMLSGSANYVTFSAWMRVTAGTSVTIPALTSPSRIAINGTPQAGDYVLTSAAGWVHVEITLQIFVGTDVYFPNLYGTSGSTIQIAMPVLVPGRHGVGIHESPISAV